MSRHNLAFITGAVLDPPMIQIDDDGNYVYGICWVEAVRGFREVGDNKRFMKSDNPIIMSRDPSILKKMEEWETGDIVQIKGVIAAKNILKTSHCKYCGAKNSAEGSLVYVNPIYVMKLEHCESQEAAHEYLATVREISNQVYLLGTLCRDPKKVSPKEGLIITQYQIALNRKYFIRSDPPEIRSDYPWVKSYGENALEDKKHLHVGSKVFIDGFLQARSVQKHQVCEECGEKYDWKDRALEIVPYETEYIYDYYTDKDIAEMEHAEAENLVNSILRAPGATTPTDDENEDFALF